MKKVKKEGRREFSDVQRRMTEKTHGSKKYNRNKDGFKRDQERDYRSWKEGGDSID